MTDNVDKAEQFKKQNAEKSKIEERTKEDGTKEYLDEPTGEWVSKNELKTREKLRQKAIKEAEKKAKKAEETTDKPKKEGAKAVEEELDPSKYRENRIQMLEQMRAEGGNPYPHKFHRDLTVQQFRDKYEEEKIENSVFKDEKVALAGRVMGLRQSGAKLLFIDLHEGNAKVQIFANAANYTGDFDYLVRTLRYGDIIGVEGNPGRTKTGELSIRPTNITLLSFCLH